MERTAHGDFGWVGMDLRTAPERLEPGQAQMLLNVRPLPGGQLEARPGWRGMLTSAQGSPIYGLTAYRRSGTTRLFWSGNNALYYADAGDTSATTVTGSVTVASATVRTARWGSYIYGVDGTNALFRWAGTGNAAVTPSLTTPTTAPAASTGAAGTILVSPGAATGDWTQPYDLSSGSYYPPTTNLLSEPNFDTSSGTTFTGLWNTDAGQPSIQSAAVPAEDGGFQFAELDADGGPSAPEYVITDAITVPTDLAAKGARVYVVEANAWGESVASTTQVLSAEVRLYTDAGTTLVTSADTTQAQYSAPLVEGSGTDVRFLFDWRSVSEDVLAAKLRLGAPNASGTAGVNVNQVVLRVPKMELGLAGSGGSLIVKQGSVQVWEGTLLTAGLRLYYDTAYSDNTVWTGKTSLYFDLTPDSGVSGLSLRMLAYSGGSWVEGPFLVAAAGGGYTADLTQFSASVLADIDGFGLQFEDDVVIDGLADNGDAHIFTLASVSEGGNLTTGYAYSYRFSETDGSWTPSAGVDYYEGQDIVESSGSPVSVSVTPTAGARQVTLTIPARVNSGADHVLVWREGGVYDDGRFRLVGVVSSSASSQTFTDNNADADLYERPIYQIGRDTFPTALTCLCVHQGRLWAAKGNTVYVSWVLQSGQETGVYTTLVPDPEDPFVGEKGASFTLDAAGNADAIKALIPMGTVVVALRENSVSVISGYDATNFAAQPYLQDAGIGSVSGPAAAVFGGQLWYLSPVGVYTFNGDNAVYRSLPIETRLHSNTVDLTTAFAVSHDQRLYLCSKYLGSSVNSNVWVFDGRTNGWFRYGCPSTIGFTSGCSLSSAADSGVLYMGGSDGQIYAHTAGTFGDKLTPAGSTTAYTAQVITRLYGQHQNFGVSRLGDGRVTQVDFDVYTAATPTLTIRVDNESGVYESGTWVLGTGRTAGAKRGWLGIKGVGHSVDLSASVSSSFQINGVSVMFAENGVRRV